ncbi:DUF898 family protein [Horticoccus sp. 23ND18S-11]|uniref:DUF898 family protein n=1 Tax=Horticoccus sp. 23ND18S-11 TaxID=3391832 RepID=UPI0039C93DD5
MFTIIGADGKEYGPVSAEQIKQWMAENRLTRDMQAKLAGTSEWKRIGEFPEFAPSMPPPMASATPLPPNADGSMTAEATMPAPPAAFTFTADWGEYFKIWIVNVLLTIVTIGIYAAWAKVRRRRYFYSNTRLFGHTFEYLADPVRILYGNLIVVGLFLLLTLSQVVSPILYIGLAILFAIAAPWLIIRALAFNARNTAWRGLRFHFNARYGEAAVVFLLWPLLIPFTLGLILPLVTKKQKEFILSHHAFGTSPLAFTGRTEEFYKIFGIAVLFFLPAIALYFVFIAVVIAASARQGGQPPPMAMFGTFGLLLIVAIPLAIAGTFFFRARMFNLVWNHTSLAGNTFVATMRARDLFLTHFLNSIVTGLTGGLLHPWAAVRMIKFQLDSLRVIPAGNIDSFVAASQPPVGAVGDSASDFFDFDIGFGV